MPKANTVRQEGQVLICTAPLSRCGHWASHSSSLGLFSLCDGDARPYFTGVWGEPVRSGIQMPSVVNDDLSGFFSMMCPTIFRSPGNKVPSRTRNKASPSPTPGSFSPTHHTPVGHHSSSTDFRPLLPSPAVSPLESRSQGLHPCHAPPALVSCRRMESGGKQADRPGS